MSETPGFENRCEKTLNEGRHVCLQMRGHEGECRANVNAPWPPVPATPLDVEACVRLLTELADAASVAVTQRRSFASHCSDPMWCEEQAEHYEKRATTLRALASALPGMGKDSERLDTLESWTKGDQTICPPGNHGGENTHWLLARDDDAKGDRYGIWSETTEGPTLREAIDAARAAQPEETSADAG